MNDIIDLIVSNGLAVVIVGYFLYKDYEFNGQLISLMQETNVVLATLKDIITRGDIHGE